eukprot:TRINITY_DN998_c1_g4_i1.p1 TRINITY_DN998_c1_g4~~TRINITY_DN998_c1_g4_i1.p1  ORF type:complete len:378 (+),score=37.26 TRINITY_DN998_c1_g4_i1:85-1134(+)
MLEDCIVDKLLFLGDVDVLLCGDINARTGNNLPNIMSERDLSNSHLKEDIEKDVRRCSQDKILNSYGKKLLNVCSVIGLYILNGVCNGDLEGHYTYISDTGCSVNDYFLASSDLFHSLRKRITLNVIERIESDHLPVLLYIEKQSKRHNIIDASNFVHNNVIVKYCWKQIFAQRFACNMNSEEVKEKLVEAEELIDTDVNKALKRFNDIIKEQAVDMTKRVAINTNIRDHEWFDQECKLAKRGVRRLLRKFNRTLDKDDRSLYCIARREYKNLNKRKKKDYNDSLLTELVNSVKSQKEFWDAVHKISKRKSQPSNDISIQEWFHHFKTVLDTDNDDDDGDDVCLTIYLW